MFFFGIAFVGSITAAADLTWNSTRQTLHPPSGADKAEGIFIYTNRGGAPITIQEVKPSCGCITAGVDKKIIQPGESGTLRAIFKTGASVGHYSKSITVITDDLGYNSETLLLEIDLTAPYALSPRLLQWRLGSTAATQRAELRFTDGAEFESPKLIHAVDGFAVKFEPVEGNPRVFAILVTPNDTSAVHRASAMIEFQKRGTPHVVPQVLLIVE